MNLLPPYSTTVWKAIGVSIGLMFLIGAVLFGIDRCSAWNSNRKIEKARQAVNAALSNLANAQTNLAVDKAEEARRVEDVKIATNQLIEASNATDRARAETNQALSNLASAVNANLPVNTTSEDIQRRLDELDK